MIRVTFTPAEVAFLTHRLSVPECIAEALTDHGDDDHPVVLESEHEVSERADQECKRLDLYAFTDCSPSDTLASAIYLDAIEGSTYMASARSNLSPQAAAAAYRATESAARKLAVAFRWTVVPTAPRD